MAIDRQLTLTSGQPTTCPPGVQPKLLDSQLADIGFERTQKACGIRHKREMAPIDCGVTFYGSVHAFYKFARSFGRRPIVVTPCMTKKGTGNL